MLIQPGAMLSPTIRRRGIRSRLLFHWRARDLSLTPVTGQVPTFTRASAGGAVADREGRLYTPVHSQPRFEMVDTDGDATAETAGLLIEYGRTNLVTQSENFGAWSVSGTPVLTGGQADPFGGTAAYLVNDDAGGALEYIFTNPAFTGDGLKAVSVFARPGSSTAHQVVLVDTIAVANRLVAVNTWAGGLPSVVATTGAYLGYRRYVDAVGVYWYRLFFQATTVTAANTNQLRLFPTDNTAASTGTTYYFGAQCEDAAYPSSYIRTAGSTVARSTDRLTYPLNLGPLTAATDDFTLYARFARPNHADAVGSIVDFPGILSLGGSQPDLRMYFNGSSRQFQFVARDNALATAFQAPAVPVGAVLEACVQFKDLTVLPAVAADVGAGLSTFATGAAGPIASFGGGIIGLGEINNGGHKLGAPLFEAKIANALLSLDQMREAF